MKKLSLKQLNLEPGALLQKEELTTVTGGYDGFDCAAIFRYCWENWNENYTMFNSCMMTAGC